MQSALKQLESCHALDVDGMLQAKQHTQTLVSMAKGVELKQMINLLFRFVGSVMLGSMVMST
ncbi:hypothetical protein AVENLUH13518_00769 [Acinetobacter venetianus]|uniref:Uncharacterized protein n=1 Tax=Acinetobacter venetianus TaxID=52133 RepID=A0A150HZ83_9GAMM|nr:hypothetical protein AVENLUH13518_00769 [Acinetobacter venetianus]